MKTRVMMLAGLAACLLAAGPRPLWAQAEVQTVADRADREDRQERGGERTRARMGGPGRPSDAEIEEVLAFMREHSPNRIKATESLPDDSAARRGVMAFVLARYRALQAVKDEDAKLYDIKLKQVEIEDELYGLLAPARSPAEREKMRGQIREVTRRLVQENMAEREQRLNRLRESLQREEQKLNSDREQTDGIVDTRTSLLIQEGPGALRKEMLRHGGREELRREGRPAGATTRAVER